jgi:hypothetical protein
VLPRWRMAPSTFDIVVLSSSPPNYEAQASTSAAAPQSLSPSPPFSTHTHAQRVAMSALSPLQPSPLASPQRKTTGALRSGSKAATIPEGALRGFATARSLVADADADEELPEFDWGLAGGRKDDDEGRTGTTGSRKAAEKNTAAGGPNLTPRAKTTSKPTTTRKRAPALTTSSHFANPSVEPALEPLLEPAEALDNPPRTKTTKSRKPRAKKAPAADGETQTTIKKGRVTKPRASTKATKAKEKAPDVVSAHFRAGTDGGRAYSPAEVRNGEESILEVPTSPSSKEGGVSRQRPTNQPLELDEAVSRRRDWTPTKDTVPLHVLPICVGKENESTDAIANEGSFTNLLSGYTYAHLNVTSDATSKALATEGSGVMKRRRIEVCAFGR